MGSGRGVSKGVAEMGGQTWVGRRGEPRRRTGGGPGPLTQPNRKQAIARLCKDLGVDVGHGDHLVAADLCGGRQGARAGGAGAEWGGAEGGCGAAGRRERAARAGRVFCSGDPLPALLQAAALLPGVAAGLRYQCPSVQPAAQHSKPAALGPRAVKRRHRSLTGLWPGRAVPGAVRECNMRTAGAEPHWRAPAP